MENGNLKISGTEIYLRRLNISDVNDEYHSWLNDPTVNQFLEIRHKPVSKQEISEYILSLKNRVNIYFLAICRQSDDRHIGNIKLGPINPIHRFGEISIVIGEKSCRGKGYGADAIKLLTGYAFDQLNMNRLSAGIYQNNIGSYKAFLQAGFIKEGVFRKMRKYNNEWVDQVMVGIIKDDWEKQK